MAKYYRVKKDTSGWEAGAIIKQADKDNDGSPGNYEAISNLWDTPAAEKIDGYSEYYKIVEHSPDWFERVYEVSVLGKARYLAKDAAKKLHDELYKGGE